MIKIYDMTHADKVIIEHKICPPLMARMGTGGNQVPLVLMDQGGGVMNVGYEKVGMPRAYRISSVESNSMRSANPHSGIRKVDISPTLDTTPPTPAKNQGGLMVVTDPHVFKIRSGCEGGGKGYLGQDERSFTLSTGHSQDVFTAGRVRRLTPTECERLQGFPDNWTRVPYRGRPADACPDAPRYKAIGNSWAVPCVRWIGERINKQLEGVRNG